MVLNEWWQTSSHQTWCQAQTASRKNPLSLDVKSKLLDIVNPNYINYGFTTRLCNLHLNMTLPYLFTFYPFHVYQMSCGSTPKHARFLWMFFYRGYHHPNTSYSGSIHTAGK